MRKISGYRILGNRLFMTIECSQSVHSIVYCLFRRATDGARTRDLHLGKVYKRLEGTETPDKYGIHITVLQIFI